MDKLSDEKASLTPKFISPTYEIVKKIGEGGFGQVYKAQNTNTGQTVAIKILTLNPDFDINKRRRYIERFERETYLGSRLHHPNIVRLLDKGQCENDQIYAVFEYVDGQTLKDRLFSSGPLAPEEAADIMSQALDALAHAHKQGVIHRDIKPANIMLTKAGAKTHVKILDFGIGALTNAARELDYKSITLTQETLGTPSYSAPEQLRGEPPTPKTDLYVWGLVFIECLTGVPTVSGSSLASVFQKQLNSTNIPIPPALAGHPVAPILRRVLNKKLDERAGSALDIYHVFTKLNFSNLVGNLNDQVSSSTTPRASQDTSTLEKTAHEHGSFFQSGLTEQKQITAMCVTLTMRTIDDREDNALDTEIIHTLHQDQKAQCVDIALQYGAQHAGTLGDTLLFYFGYPTVSDNDGRLCARSALELLSQLKKRNSLLQLSQGVESYAHIGIHSGMITVYPDTLPEGDTPNIAMALSRAAGNNHILCSEPTRKILEHFIEFKYKTALQLGLNASEVPVFSLTGERMVEAFGFLRANRRHQGFVGREHELTQLENVLNSDRNTDTHLRTAHVYGEAGIGKSRLVHEFRSRASTYTHYVSQCLPEYKNNALYPILELVKHKYTLGALTDDGKIERLSTLINVHHDIHKQNALFVLCTWLNLAIPDHLPPHKLSPDESKAILFETLVHLLCYNDSSERNQQSLFIFEDMHWADPTSIEFIKHFITHSNFVSSAHAFVSISREALPEMLRAHVPLLIAVENLKPEHTSDFITYLFNQKQIAKDVLDLIVRRTDGIPLFIEELVDMLNQKELVHEINGLINFSNPDSIVDVPNSLRDSLQQKLDNLHYAKETAQLASAIGREFNYELLKQCAQHDEAKLQAELQELIQSELVFVQRKVEGDSYIFKHALVRDAAYGSMVSSHRKNIHKQIAESLQTMRVDSHSDTSSLLAMHWGEAQVYDKAISCGNNAAQEALKRSSSQEALALAEKIEQWIDHLNKDAQIDAKLDNYGLYTSAYMETKGWASEEVLKYSEASISLLKSANRTNELVSRLWWKMLTNTVGARRDTLQPLSDELDSIVNKTHGVPRTAIRAVQGFYQFTCGHRLEAVNLLLDAIESYDKHADRTHQQEYGFDVGCFATMMLGRVYGELDDMDKAFHYTALSVEQARSYDNFPTLGLALMYQGIVHQQYNNKDIVKECVGELITVSEKLELPAYKGYGQMLYDWSIDDPSNAQQVFSDLMDTGSRFSLEQFYSFYSDAYFSMGEYEKASDIITHCLTFSDDINEPYYQPLLRTKLLENQIAQQKLTETEILSELDTIRQAALQKNFNYAVKRADTIQNHTTTNKTVF